ncbi:hypothetical protein DFH06DRAFT_1442094 [Mycena polygramma]|nr:hypothetical protein DFH06DRAFT_1442094 [Mycena polygramma]
MSSNNSSVRISGIFVLENPQTVSVRVVAFNASIYIGAPSMQEIQGSLRYFKEEHDNTQYPARGLYYVEFMAAKREAGYDVFTADEVEQAKFLFVGDIKKFNLLETQDIDDEDAAWNINACQTASVHVSCAVLTSNPDTATFTAAPTQYTSASADAKRAAESAGTPLPPPSTFPLSGYIPDSHRFKDNKKKPTPFVDRYCGFTGDLTGICSALEGAVMVDRFRIAVDTVTFLGAVPKSEVRSTPVPSASQAPSGSAPKRGRWAVKSTLGKRKESDNGPSSSPSPSVG